jgi:hypothetical protein
LACPFNYGKILLKGGVIMSKDFKDFKKLLNEDEMIKISTNAADIVNSNKNLNALERSVAASNIIAIQLLEKYHNWLNSDQ